MTSINFKFVFKGLEYFNKKLPLMELFFAKNATWLFTIKLSEEWI